MVRPFLVKSDFCRVVAKFPRGARREGLGLRASALAAHGASRYKTTSALLASSHAGLDGSQVSSYG